MAEDYGGPRREFFTLMLREIKEKFFDSDDGDLPISNEYYTIGVLLGMFINPNFYLIFEK